MRSRPGRRALLLVLVCRVLTALASAASPTNPPSTYHTTARHNNIHSVRDTQPEQVSAYADNVPLPAFARRCRSNRSISPARRRAHSSMPAAAGLLL